MGDGPIVQRIPGSYLKITLWCHDQHSVAKMTLKDLCSLFLREKRGRTQIIHNLCCPNSKLTGLVLNFCMWLVLCLIFSGEKVNLVSFLAEHQLEPLTAASAVGHAPDHHSESTF